MGGRERSAVHEGYLRVPTVSLTWSLKMEEEQEEEEEKERHARISHSWRGIQGHLLHYFLDFSVCLKYFII